MKRRVILCSFLVVAACGERPALWDRDLDVVGPIHATGHLVWLNKTTATVVAIEVGTARAPHARAVASRPRDIAPLEGGVLVLGGRGERPRLQFVPLPDGDTVTLDLPVPYDRLAVSPDGRFAVLSFDASAPIAPGGVPARNNNEVGVVDIGRFTLTRTLLQSESLNAREIVFSPDGRLAAVILDAAISVVELARPVQSNVTVPLRLDDGSTLSPFEALFSPRSDFIYVRTSSSTDVLTLELDESTGALDASVNFLFVPGARRLGDILVPTAASMTNYVIALFEMDFGGVVAMLDQSGDTSLTRMVTLGKPASHMALVADEQLLIFGDNSVTGSSTFSRYVAGWNPATGRFHEDSLPGTYSRLPDVGDGIAFFSHRDVKIDGVSTPAAITGVHLYEDDSRLRVRMSPVVLAGDPVTGPFDSGLNGLVLAVNVLREESGAAPARPGEDFDPTVGYLFLIDTQTQPEVGVVLDKAVSKVGVIADHVYGIHNSSVGDVTLVPTADFSRARALRYEGFFLAGAANISEVQ